MRLPFLIQPGQLPGQLTPVEPAGQASRYSPQNVLPPESPYETVGLIFGAAAIIGLALLLNSIDKAQREQQKRLPPRPYPYAV